MCRTKVKRKRKPLKRSPQLSDRQFSIVAEIAPLFGTQFRTTNIFGSPLLIAVAFNTRGVF
jgi:hypothetical protein